VGAKVYEVDGKTAVVTGAGNHNLGLGGACVVTMYSKD